MCQHLWTCRHVLICADMCRHVPTCETTLNTTDINQLKLILHASICQHIWTCRHVLICADMCWHLPTCQHVQPLSEPLIQTIWNLSCMLAYVSKLGHADISWYPPSCAGMCQHVPTYNINVPTCAGKCQHVKPLAASLIPTIWNLFCMLTYVSTFGHADMCWYVPTCADMCRHANMWNHSQHLWYQSFETYLACWHVSAHFDMPTCADMCRHVPICADMWHWPWHLW